MQETVYKVQYEDGVQGFAWPGTNRARAVVSEVPDSISNPPEQTEDESLDDFIRKNNFIAPYDYYGTKYNNTSIVSDGVNNLSKNGSDTEVKYFWVEDLKNWATYNVYQAEDTNTGKCCFKTNLRVWNGKDGWVDAWCYGGWGIILTTGTQFGDTYNIQPYQSKVIDPRFVVAKYRGVLGNNTKEDCKITTLTPDRTVETDYYKEDSPDYMNMITGLRLQKTYRYNINDLVGNSFQTNRFSNLCYKATPYSTKDFYKASNFRCFIPTKVPAVWRMSTGEIFLAVHFNIGADGGKPYHFVKKEDGLKKGLFIPSYDRLADPAIDAFNEAIAATSEVYSTVALKTSEIAEYIVNECIKIFGDGKTKTIENDWLRKYSKTTESVSVETDYSNMLDSSLMFEQTNVNEINNQKCTFKVNRPTVITDTPETIDYVKKW
jgi:hypothetical protein